MMDLNMNQELNDIKISGESFVSSAKSAFISPAAWLGCFDALIRYLPFEGRKFC